MAREIKIISWCDRHAIRHERKEAADRPVSIWLYDHLVELDLCEECTASVSYKEILELAQEYGVAPESQRQQARTPGKPARVTPQGSSGAISVSRLEMLRDQMGSRKGRTPMDERHLPCLLCTLDYASDSGLRRHFTVGHYIPTEMTGYLDVFGEVCPLCNGRYGQLGGHATRAHDTNTPALFRLAEAEGDPHGVVAEVRKHLAEVIAQHGERVRREIESVEQERSELRRTQASRLTKEP